MDKKESSRLPDYIKPSNYNLKIEPSEDMNSYTGSVQIKAVIDKPTKNIILNSKNLEIKSATMCIGSQCLLPKSIIDKESETLILENQNAVKGEVEIDIEFSGKITEDLVGIYKSKYEHNKKSSHIITTQCEAPYARRIFPCFDEPNKKATFNLELVINKELKAVSNMLPESEKTEKGKKIVKFKTTPKMSTYLLYIGIGDFEFSEENYKNVKIRIVTTPGKSKNTKFALEHTKKYLEYFEDYSEIPYPLEKLDMIAVPDFQSGAMENWGAITFRELLLLVDEKTSSTSIKKRVAEVIAHELWHQWSGNLVTMEWWNDLWLNESFATYMAYKAVSHYHPEWKIWEDYLLGILSGGLFKDSLKSTHPIEVEVKSPAEIEEIFDEISYNKGGSILRMLDSYLGQEPFRIGVSNYLKKYAYKNAVASDLWNSLHEVSKDKKVKELMKYWISEPGYPLVNVEKTKTSLKLSQKRYNNNTNQLWPIPISICTEDVCHYKILDKKEETYDIKEKSIKLNHKQLGFYRAKYSNELLLNLGYMIKQKKLDEADRWGVQNDLWALCSIGEETVENYISFLNNYTEETSYTILSEICSSIKKLDRLYQYESWWPKTKNKITNNLLPIYKNHLKRLGWYKVENEEPENALMRNICISFCSFANDPDTIKKAKEIYSNKAVELDIANSVYYSIAINGDEKDFNTMFEKYEKSTDTETKIRLLSGLYQFTKPKILEKALDLALTDKVRMQNLRYVFGSILSNPAAQKVIANWSKANWSELEKNKDNHHIFKDFLDALIVSQTKNESKKEVKSILDKNKVQYERTKANAFEILDMNLKLIEKNKKFLENY